MSEAPRIMSAELPEYAQQSGSNWMITFADLLSLILTFFVLLYSMSALEDNQKWEEITKSLSQKLNPNKDAEEQAPAAQISVTRISMPKAANIDYLATIITDKFNDSPELSTMFSVRKLDDRIIISLIGARAFTEGEKELTNDGLYALSLIGEIIQTVGNRVDIYGTAPDETGSSSWHLALSRAFAVSRALRNMGYEYKLSQFGRVISNEQDFELTDVPKEKRETFSRRVDIIIRQDEAEL